MKPFIPVTPLTGVVGDFRGKMSNSAFEVIVIKEGRDQDYWDFWKHGKKVNVKGETLDSALLGFSEIVKAKNKQEAESLVKQKYPNLTIDPESTNRLG